MKHVALTKLFLGLALIAFASQVHAKQVDNREYMDVIAKLDPPGGVGGGLFAGGGGPGGRSDTPSVGVDGGGSNGGRLGAAGGWKIGDAINAAGDVIVRILTHKQIEGMIEVEVRTPDGLYVKVKIEARS